jgi:hypothetical protein|eukprot:TRINITY_DN74936_c0_g1_i1.p1 TRINITY_DN74936_c0_g1~~TRINITY_DN74936_c0_g1_i1.p1  ORF type:complete len:340 (-),score=66.71 TRINITY_DN74936_c0_g1_i1:266-1222(-)
MVELRVDLCNSDVLNEDCFVSVRVGEFQKLARLAQSRSYRFPKANKHIGKIEVYKRIGACSVDCDPSFQELREVTVKCNDESVGNLGFKVAVSGDAVEQAQAVQKAPSKKAAIAKDYVTKHGLEAHLSDAMQALLRERPSNPTEFLAEKLLEFSRTGGIMYPPASPKLKNQAQPIGQAETAVETVKPKYFAMNPSVGTWLAKPIRISKTLETKSFNFRPSVGTWLVPTVEEEHEVSLAQPAESTRVWKSKPSVGTWLAKPMPVLRTQETKSFNFRPSVGSWLVPQAVEDKPERPKAMVVSSMQLYGASFPFSTGIRIL